MQTLNVDLAERSYPIYIGEVLNNSDLFARHIASERVCVVTNTTVAELYLPALKTTLADFEVDTVVLPDGEAHKNLTTLNQIFDSLLELKHNRKTTIIALGGGVVGDMAGFAAACYQRGVNFIQVPTTLLSQVDSSVGGKTGVNHALGKNMIGAFYQPQCVLADTTVLQSLPARELSAGVAEVIKYGLIADARFFSWLEENIGALMRLEPAVVTEAIYQSCSTKAQVVAMDEREGGIRAILNLGHTFGHAIEAAMGYGTWLHGEAVGAGMLMAADLSHRLGLVSADVVKRTQALLLRAELPVQTPEQISLEQYLDYMSVDKKVLDGRIRLVLLKQLGQAFMTSDVAPDLLAQTIAASRQAPDVLR